MKNNPDYYDRCVYYPLSTKIKKVSFRYDTEPFVDKFCLPSTEQSIKAVASIVDEFKGTFDNLLAEIGVDSFLRDIGKCSDLLVYTIFSAFLVGFLYLILLRFVAGIIVYAAIVVIFLGTAYGGYVIYDEGQ